MAGQPLPWAHVRMALQAALGAACGRDVGGTTTKPVRTPSFVEVLRTVL